MKPAGMLSSQPSKSLAFVAIAAGEKSIFILGMAVVGAVVALFALRPSDV